MAELTKEQRKALALARAKAEAARARNAPETMEAAAQRVPPGMVYDPERGQYVDTEAEAARRYASEPGYRLGAYGAKVVSGVPFVGEWVDEGMSEIGRARWRAGKAQIEEQNPLASALGSVGGALATAAPAARALAPLVAGRAPASLAGRVAYGATAGAAGGAAEGAVSGAGAADGPERGAGALRGGVIGAGAGLALGMAAPAFEAGVAKGAKHLLGRSSQKEAAAIGGGPISVPLVGEALVHDGGAAAVRHIRSGGPDAMAGDAGRATGGLLDAAIQSGGRASQLGRKAVEERAGRANATLTEALNGAFGPLSARINPDAAVRDRLYTAAYRSPVDYSGKAGRQIEEALADVPESVIAKANRLIASESRVHRRQGTAPQQIMATIGDDGKVTFTEMPNVLQLDYITRALGDMVKENGGALGGMTNQSRIYANLIRDIRTPLKEAAPAYKVALSRAARDISIEEAQNLGEVALRAQTRRSDLREAVATMEPPELAGLRRGVRAYIDENMANVRRAISDPNMDAREAMKGIADLSSRAARDKVEMILGDKAAAHFYWRYDQAARALALRARTADNSATMARTTTRDRVQGEMEPGLLGHLQQGSPGSAAKALIQRLTKATPADRARMEEQVFAEISQMLTGPRGPDAAKAAIQLIRALERQPITEELAQRLGSAVGRLTVEAGYPLVAQ